MKSIEFKILIGHCSRYERERESRGEGEVRFRDNAGKRDRMEDEGKGFGAMLEAILRLISSLDLSYSDLGPISHPHGL